MPGLLAVLLATLCYGALTVGVKKLSTLGGPMTVDIMVSVVCVVGGLGHLLVLWALRGVAFEAEAFRWREALPWAALNFALVCAAHPLMLLAFARSSAAVVTTVESLHPVVALALFWALGQEPMSWRTLLGPWQGARSWPESRDSVHEASVA